MLFFNGLFLYFNFKKMIINIPGFKNIEIKNLVLDYNGTIANNGQLIDGVDTLINKIAENIQVFVITADTFGTVEIQLKNTNCKVLKITNDNQKLQKLALVQN